MYERSVASDDPRAVPAWAAPSDAAGHKAFHGLCLAIVKVGRTAGTMRLEARADGFALADVTIQIR